MKSPILWTSKNGSGGVLCLPCFELKLGEGLMWRGDRLEGCCYSAAARQRRAAVAPLLAGFDAGHWAQPRRALVAGRWGWAQPRRS